MPRMLNWAFLLCASLGLLSCASGQYETGTDEITRTNRAAANNLIRMAGEQAHPGANIIAASFANIDDLTRSSTFGRVASRQLTTQFTAAGYPVVEMLLRDSIYIREGEGEFLLSRDLDEIGTQHSAELVLVGTYAVADSHVFITAKLVRTADSVVVASHDYVLPYTRDMRILLRDW